MRCPAAPYYEGLVRGAAEGVCREHGLSFKVDKFGNLLVKLDKDTDVQPLVLSAHLDHPGFEIIGRPAPDRFQARFLGGVPDSYFLRDVPVRLYPGDTRALLGKRLKGEKEFELKVKGSVKGGSAPTHAVWDLEEFSLNGRIIRGRACDDLVGAATILATLIELKRSKAKVNVVGVLSRAEEVGFQGALALIESRLLPRDGLVISLETSKELPPIQMGKGVIVRVGDKASIFNTEGTRFLTEVASAMQQADKKFTFQRALMSGGTCEATAYQELGYQTAAVCVALGNYHNCGPNNRIAEEFVHSDDARGMVRLLVEAAKQMRQYDRITGLFVKRLQKLQKEGIKELLKRPLD